MAESPVSSPVPDAGSEAVPKTPKTPQAGESTIKEYREALENAEKEHAAVMVEYKEIKAKLDLIQPSKDKDSPNPKQKRRQELIAKANEIRQKQAGGKSARTSKQDQIKRLDEQLRSRITEQKNGRSKVSFKNVAEIDSEINRLESQVNGGMMKLVDEKKALTDISNMRKTRKNFAQFESQQGEIDELKAKIKEIKDTMDDPEQKALSEEYNKIQAEIDVIKAEMDEAYKGLSSLRDERTRLQNLQREKYDALRTAKKTLSDYEWEAKKRARERRRAEDVRRAQEQKMERAQKMLDEASIPAFVEEIRRAASLMHFFDPSSPAPEKAPLLASSGLEAQATRQVDDSALKGMKLVRKEDREDEYFAAASKGKKGKKNKNVAAAKTFSCPPSVMEDCAFVGIDPPMSAADLPAAIEKVKAKLDKWKADQASQTQQNVDKAKKEIEKLEAEEAAQESGANGVNGKSADAKVAEVTSDLKDASIEDKTETEKEVEA